MSKKKGVGCVVVKEGVEDEEVVEVKVEKDDDSEVSVSEDEVMQTADEDAEVKMEAKEEEEGSEGEEGDEESAGWKEESLVKDEESEESGGEDDAGTAAAGKGKRKAELVESPNKKQKKASSASRGTKASPTKRKRTDGDDEEAVAEKKKAKATSLKKKAKKKTKKKKKKDKEKPAPEKEKKAGRRKKRKAPARRRKKPNGKGSPSDDSSSSSSDSEADAAAGIQESLNQVIFPLKRITVGSWVRGEGARDALSLKWRLRNEGTKNSELSIEMKSRSKWEAGKRMIFRRLEIDRIKKGRRREGNQVLLTFELTCPPIFERFMPLPGTRGNKWVRTSDFTKGEAQANKRVQLLTTGEACKKFLKLTKRWTKLILVRSLRDRPRLYWHATLNNKMAPAATPLAKLESPDAEPVVDDKAVCGPVKPEAPRDDELNIQSLPQEVLMQIVGYMDAKHVLQSVSLVSHTFHSLSNDELLWKTYFRRFCGSLVYSVEEAAWDALPSRFASWKEALATTNAMCFFRTRASKRFVLKDEELVASPLRRLTKYNMHANVVRWFIVDEVASFAKSLKRERAAMTASQILLDDDDDDDDDNDDVAVDGEGEQEELWHYGEEEDNDEVQVVATKNKKRVREVEEE